MSKKYKRLRENDTTRRLTSDESVIDRRTVLAAVFGIPTIMCTTAAASQPSHDLALIDELVAEVVQRLEREALPGQAHVIHLQVGAASIATLAGERLKQRLSRSRNVIIASVVTKNGPPVPDGAGGHVHVVEHGLEPRPHHVVLITFAEGAVVASMRIAGPDPLVPHQGEWIWSIKSKPLQTAHARLL